MVWAQDEMNLFLALSSILFVLAALVNLDGKFVPLAWSANTSSTSTTSNVTVNSYVSIALTSALSNGVTFGSLDPNTDNTAATSCANAVCNISVSADTNIAVDMVLKANAALTRQGGAQTIPYANYTWNSTAGTGMPLNNGGYALSGTYDYTNKVGSNIAAGGKATWQSWLDIPSAQTSGVYNNTVSFCATTTGATDC